MTTMLSELSEPIQASAPAHEIRTLLDSGFEWQATGEADIVLDDLREQLSHVPGLYDSIYGHAEDFTAKVASPLLFLKLEVTDQKPEDIDTYNPNKIVLYEENGELTGGMMTRVRRLIMGGSGSSMATMTDEEAYMAAFKMKRLILALGSFRVDDLTALDIDFSDLIDTLAAMGIAEDVIEDMIALLISGDAPPAFVEAIKAIIAIGQSTNPAEVSILLQKLETSLTEALPQAKSEKVASILGRITQALQRIIKAEPSNLLLGMQTYKTLMALDVAPEVAREMTTLIISGDAPPALMETARAIVTIGRTSDLAQIPTLLQKMEMSLLEAVPQVKTEKMALALGRISEDLQPVIKAGSTAIMPKIQAFQRGEPPKLSERLSALKIITNVVQITAELIRNPDLPKADKDKLSLTLASLRVNIFNPQSPVFNQAFVRLATQIIPLGDKLPLGTKGMEGARPSMLSLRVADAVQAISKVAFILMPPAVRQALPLPVGIADKPSALLNVKLSDATMQSVMTMIAKPALSTSTDKIVYAIPLTPPKIMLRTIEKAEVTLVTPIRSGFGEITTQARNDNQMKINPLRAVTKNVAAIIGEAIARVSPTKPISTVTLVKSDKASRTTSSAKVSRPQPIAAPSRQEAHKQPAAKPVIYEAPTDKPDVTGSGKPSAKTAETVVEQTTPVRSAIPSNATITEEQRIKRPSVNVEKTSPEIIVNAFAGSEAVNTSNYSQNTDDQKSSEVHKGGIEPTPAEETIDVKSSEPKKEVKAEVILDEAAVSNQDIKGPCGDFCQCAAKREEESISNDGVPPVAYEDVAVTNLDGTTRIVAGEAIKQADIRTEQILNKHESKQGNQAHAADHAPIQSEYAQMFGGIKLGTPPPAKGNHGFSQSDINNIINGTNPFVDHGEKGHVCSAFCNHGQNKGEGQSINEDKSSKPATRSSKSKLAGMQMPPP